MVFIPLLYTDVTDAWQLKSRKQRVIISAAGMIVEIMLAGIATLLWAFLADGTVKDITFLHCDCWLVQLFGFLTSIPSPNSMATTS